jgi:rhamnose transport system permease protein
LGDQSISGYPEVFSTLGNAYLGQLIGVSWLVIPVEFVVLLLLALAAGLFLHRTTMGRRVYAIGANPVAARFSGIAADRYRFALFVFAGLSAGLAAILLTGRIGSTRPNIAMGWELDAITMVILGGVGTLWGGVLGAAALLLLQEGLAAQTQHWEFWTGWVLLATVLFARHGLAGAVAAAWARWRGGAGR